MKTRYALPAVLLLVLSVAAMTFARPSRPAAVGDRVAYRMPGDVFAGDWTVVAVEGRDLVLVSEYDESDQAYVAAEDVRVLGR